MNLPIVNVKQGKLRGLVASNHVGESYFKFHGIPYGKIPKRFQEAEPPASWTGIRDATKENDGCYSRSLITGKIIGSEDCLYLNVYTKQLPDTDHHSSKAVLVWLYGGSYIKGNGNTDLYGPDFLLTEDIVLVTLNYRTGIIGFLDFEDPSIPAIRNLGLKDQRLALKWVQENIEYFGGDPNNVTIFGESAGASSAQYHILSKNSEGLFHKAIMQSGSALSVFGLGEKNILKIVDAMGYTVDSETEAFKILEEARIQDIFKAQEKFSDFRFPLVKRLVSPVIEPEDSTLPIITQPALDIIDNHQYNDVPCIYGHTADEGNLIDVSRLLATTDSWECNGFLPFHMNLDLESQLARKLGEKIKQKYFTGGEINKNDLQRLITDCVYIIWIKASIKHHVKTSKQPIYVYKMTIDSKLNCTKQLGLLSTPGAAHVDDIGYLFKTIKTPQIQEGSIEDISWRRFVKLWTNFAKYGNPTPNAEELGVVWEPVRDPEEMKTLVIGEELKMAINPNEDSVDFWKTILNESASTSNFL